MKLLKLVIKNTTRHKLRTSLTVLGLAIAVMAFSVIRTSIDAWYAGAAASSPNRLVTINKVSLMFPVPMAYKEKIEKVDGITGLTWAQWFGAIYIDKKNFFAQFAVDPETYFKLYPEFVVPPDQFQNFLSQRNSVIVGRKLADRFGWSIGDQVRLVGTFFPGNWDFNIVGIYTGAKLGTDETQFFLHYKYLDERLKAEMPSSSGQIGSFIIQIGDPSRAAEISDNIDKLFVNSIAETKTQTEEAFQLSFVSMAGSIVAGLKAVSILVIGIILLVLANTMAMTARERVGEYAMMKSLGFTGKHIIGLIFGESIFISILGGIVGIGLTYPIVNLVRQGLSDFFPIFNLDIVTLIAGFGASVIVGFIAAIFPAIKAVRTPIIEGLRIID